jgi:hypothetical protein
MPSKDKREWDLQPQGQEQVAIPIYPIVLTIMSTIRARITLHHSASLKAFCSLTGSSSGSTSLASLTSPGVGDGVSLVSVFSSGSSRDSGVLASCSSSTVLSNVLRFRVETKSKFSGNIREPTMAMIPPTC